ncbi:succinate dehydrogenase flavoprotein subunit [PVC group bacterium (ex Bugula neritina AB1)]|nr:succinate dehydrogenase flavoprotein subunit [PVC group bacterium (ex Bugula neritina AB1)]
MNLNSRIPSGPLEQKWSNHKMNLKLVSPSRRSNYTVLVVGTGLAGASAAASLSEMGYNVKSFCIQDSPRRAHSIAAQGGINAAKNYCNDGDSIFRLFYDTIKGGDYRAREANVYRLAELSNNIIDQCVAQGVPFAREYSGYLANRSFGGAQVSRTFYARGQTGQQLLLGAYGALMKEVGRGNIELFSRREMLDLIVDEAVKGITVRNLISGELETHMADAVVLATGGYSNVFFLSTNAMASNVTAAWRAYKKGACFANPCFVQIHPTCMPLEGDTQSKLTLMSESLRNDGRVWVPKRSGDTRNPSEIPEEERDYFLERIYPSFGNLVPRDVAARSMKKQCDEGRGVGEYKMSVYLDFGKAIDKFGKNVIFEKYGNLFDMYDRITGESPFQVPMRIYPAVHYTMGGLWVDYNLMSTIPGLFVLGEANFSDHGANRLGASALMQGLADGYFVAPATVSDYLASVDPIQKDKSSTLAEDSKQKVNQHISTLLKVKGNKTVDYFHKKLGQIMWNHCGIARTPKGLEEGLSLILELKERFWSEVNVLGSAKDLNQSLEKAGRVADFLEYGELMILDAMSRNESCGGHFREDFQTDKGDPLRNDKDFCHASVWEYKDKNQAPSRHQEELLFENVKLSQRSYE